MLIQLALMGILVALLPLSMVWVSSDTDKYRKLVWVTLFLTFDLIIFGAFTRLTDSGLGCPDWPGCFGQANPLQAHVDIKAAEIAMPTGPVTVEKAWIEMIHRYFAMAVGVLIVALMVIAWRRWLQSGRKNIKFSPLFPSLLFALVCVQGAFGAWTVTMKLQPIIVTTHLLLGMTLLALLTWSSSRLSDHSLMPQAVNALRLPAALAFVLLAVQIALGGWVSTNYAGLACGGFPLCSGELIPSMDFSNGFTLWRDLGKTTHGDYLPVTALTAIHWVHRAFALILTVLVVWVALRAYKIDALRKIARGLLIMIAVQFALGVSIVFLQLPLALAVAHNGGAAILLVLLVALNYKVNRG